MVDCLEFVQLVDGLEFVQSKPSCGQQHVNHGTFAVVGQLQHFNQVAPKAGTDYHHKTPVPVVPPTSQHLLCTSCALIPHLNPFPLCALVPPRI